MPTLTTGEEKSSFLIWEYPIGFKNGNLEKIAWISFIGMLYSNRKNIEPIREEFEKNGKSAKYVEMKEQLFSIMPNIAESKNRSIVGITKLSGLIYLDIDLFPRKKEVVKYPPSHYQKLAEELKEKLQSEPLIFASWLSVSGAGLGILVKTNDLTIENYNSTWEKLSDYFKKAHQITVDSSAKNINRLCYLSYDSNLYINDDAEKFNALTDDLSSDSMENIDKKQTAEGVIKEGKGVKDGIFITDKQAFFTPAIGDIGEKRFFDESCIDIHFAKDIKKIVVDNVKVRYDGNGHYWFSEGFPFVRMIGRRKKILVSERHKIILKTLVNLVFLNAHWSKGELYRWISDYNRDWCSPPLKESEMKRIMDHVYDDLRVNNKMSPCIVFKQNHFTSTTKYGKEVKLSKVGKAKCQNSVLRLAEGLKKCLDNLSPANNKKLADITGLSRPTVIHNINELNKEGVNQYIFRTFEEAKDYEGLIIEILPDYDQLIFEPKPKENDI